MLLHHKSIVSVATVRLLMTELHVLQFILHFVTDRVIVHYGDRSGNHSELTVNEARELLVVL